ncbi:MAG: ABC transporter ATP-binding protein [Candidatus Aminicenantales bacterium]
MPPLVVEAKGLTKIYAGLRAVTDLNFAVSRGELFCLVGPDGAGKSTTLRLLCGLLNPTGGEVRIFGLDLAHQADEIKKRIGYLSQQFTLYGDLTVEENLEFVAEIRKVRDINRRQEELLAFSRLTPFRRLRADNLSGGMKQKLALAATLVHSPELLLLDEPTTGIDPLSRQDFWKMIFQLLQEGMTVIFTTPYLDEAERSSRVALMEMGKLLAVDTPADMKKRLAGTAVEIRCNRLNQARLLLQDMERVEDIQAFGDHLVAVVKNLELDLPEVLEVLKNEGVRVEGWRVIPLSLENVYIFLARFQGDKSDEGREFHRGEKPQ